MLGQTDGDYARETCIKSVKIWPFRPQFRAIFDQSALCKYPHGPYNPVSWPPMTRGIADHPYLYRGREHEQRRGTAAGEPGPPCWHSPGRRNSGWPAAPVQIVVTLPASATGVACSPFPRAQRTARSMAEPVSWAGTTDLRTIPFSVTTSASLPGRALPWCRCGTSVNARSPRAR